MILYFNKQRLKTFKQNFILWVNDQIDAQLRYVKR